MKRSIILFTFIFVLSVGAFAQTISVTLSGETSGWLYYTGADGSVINSQCWYRSSETLPSSYENSGRPWLVPGVYTGQVSWMESKNRQGIIIFGGPNNISSTRGIFIHAGSRPSDSVACIVIPTNQMDLLFNDLRLAGFIQNGRTFSIRIDR